MNWIFGALEELLPVVVFFVIQQQFSFTTGLIAMTIVLFVVLLVAQILGRSLPRFAIMSTIGFLLFAVPSIVTGNSTYFQISDTILDGSFALLLLSSWVLGYPILKVFFGRIFAITDEAWLMLTWRWGMLFLLLAIANEYVRQFHTDDVWSLYKLLSTIGIMLFGCYQFTLSARLRIVSESNWLGLRTRT